MFKKILIANRGEIACRIMRACKKFGAKIVVIYTERDPNSRWYRGDEAYEIESYLDGKEIIEVALECGAEAIHPGYGFLAENAEFAQACKDAGLLFIGPSPEVINIMGNKVKALEVAQRVGLPTLPRSEEISEETGIDEVQSMALALGYPLMVKPRDGGGGIGMSIVHSDSELVFALDKARSLGQRVFGSKAIYFERYLPHASHIEVQLLGDHFGNIVHLFERDCSIQRRRQKLVEEAPSLKITAEQKNYLYACAVNLAKEVEYTNAGTVEFLADKDGEIYFVEMNPRLQVEHPITEMITRKDLVELQIKIAAGVKLPFRQSDLKMKGHAVEARIYPEILTSEVGRFLPQIGIVKAYESPHRLCVTTRFDTALFEGYEILPDFEPLIGKLICWGRTKKKACENLNKALEELTIIGVNTNILTTRAILRSSLFLSDTYDTGFLDDEDVWKELYKMASESAVALDRETRWRKMLDMRLWKNIGNLNSVTL